MYASTLAYIVDANVGWSGSAVAASNSFRGLFAFVAAEVAVPLQVSLYSTDALTCVHHLLGRYWRWWPLYFVGWFDAIGATDDTTCDLER